MPATVTLSTTTLARDVDSRSAEIYVASTAGMTPGTRLWVDTELMTVLSLGVDPAVNVQRGVDGTSGQAHLATSPVTIGRADQFYSSDPVGLPPGAIPVSPYINIVNGRTWFAQGDSSGGSLRWWQQTTTTWDDGPLGIRTTTTSPTSST